MFKEKGYDEILANVYDFTGFVSTLQKSLAEFNKTFELIAFMLTAISGKREDGECEAFCCGYRIVYQ